MSLTLFLMGVAALLCLLTDEVEVLVALFTFDLGALVLVGFVSGPLVLTDLCFLFTFAYVLLSLLFAFLLRSSLLLLEDA